MRLRLMEKTRMGVNKTKKENTMHGFNGMSWGMGMGFGWLIGLVILIILIWLIAKAVNSGTPSSPQHSKSALEILKERYAKGEINKQEFEDRKRAILS